MIASLMLIAIFSFGQQNGTVASRIAGSYPLSINTEKTTLLIFPSPVEDGVRGSKELLAEKAGKVNNILKIKASSEELKESTLHVITTDGKVYAFNVRFDPQASDYTIDVGKLPAYEKATFKGVSLNERELEQYAAMAMGSPAFIKKVKDNRHGMKFVLEGIYVKDDVLFFRYNLKNNTSIGYDQFPLEFYIRDKKRSKRTAVQDKEIAPVFIRTNGSPEAAAGQTIIVAFAKFTIAENKLLVTSVQESGGDRNLSCRLDQKKLLKAKVLAN